MVGNQANEMGFQFYFYIIDMQPDQLKKDLQVSLLKVFSTQTYQKMLVALMSAIWVLTTWVSMIGSFVFMNPLFECNGQAVTEREACSMLDQCVILNDYTAAFYCKLYCDDEFERSMIQSGLFLGAIAGMLTLVPASDLRGRRFAFIIAYSLEIAGVGFILLGIYVNVWQLMCLGQFLIGMYMATTTVLSYVITGQLCEDKMRQKSIMLYCAMWGFGEMCFLPFYLYLRQWSSFMIYAVAIPSVIIFIILLLNLVESPYYCLFMAKDRTRLEKSLASLSKYNSYNQQELERVQSLVDKFFENSACEPVTDNKLKQSLQKLVCDKNNLKTCLCLALCQSSFNIYYFGMQGSMERTGYNFGISMLLAGVHEFIGYLIASSVVSKIPRKKGLIAIIVVSSLVGLSFLIPFVSDSDVFQSIVISVARLCTVFAYSFIALLQVQSFPAEIKSTGIGASDGLSQIGKVIVPFLIILMNNIGIHPLIFSSAVYLVVGITPILFIRQTYRKPEPTPKMSLIDSVEQKDGSENLLQTGIESTSN